jgi:beta-glucanase (GH16 family)
MKSGLLIIVLLGCCLSIYAQNRFELLWEENFVSPKVDYAHWQNSYRWGRSIIANHEIEYYTNGRNFELKDSLLIITAHRENIKARVDSLQADDVLLSDSLPNLRSWNYTSGMLCSRQKFAFGKFEIRCRLPSGSGTWPAFWLYGGPCGEIDIFEKPWQFHRSITNNLHYDSAGIQRHDFRFTKLKKRNTFSKEFHTYTLEWTQDTLSWFIDGNLVRHEEHQYKNCPMELIVNLALADDNFGVPFR